MHQKHGIELDKIMQDSCPYNCFIFFQQNRPEYQSKLKKKKKQEKAPVHEKKVLSFLWGKGIFIALSSKMLFPQKNCEKKEAFNFTRLAFCLC